jgi:hypothetical protein
MKQSGDAESTIQNGKPSGGERVTTPEESLVESIRVPLPARPTPQELADSEGAKALKRLNDRIEKISRGEKPTDKPVGSFAELLKLDPAKVESIKVLSPTKIMRARMTPQQAAELSGKIALANLNRRIAKINRGEKVREQ